MKHTTLLALLLCLLAGIGHAATISGTITNLNTGRPVNGQLVWATDDPTGHGNWPYYFQSAATDAAGRYTISLPVGINNGMVHVCSNIGNSTNIQSVYYSGADLVVDYNVSCTTAYYQIHGYVDLAGNTLGSDSLDVYVIRVDRNASTNDTTLTAIDSIVAPWGEFDKIYDYNPAGSGYLLLKAALRPNHAQYANYVPTYYTGTLHWSTASSLAFPDTTRVFVRTTPSLHFSLAAGINPGGPGFIGGSVQQGANKGTGVGDPLNNRILLLTNAAGQAVAYTYSDGSGAFSFSNLAYGTYQLSGDVWGKRNPLLTVTITTAQPNVNDILFEENSREFKGHIGPLSAPSTLPVQQVAAYVNATTHQIEVKGWRGIDGVKTATLYNINGATVDRQHTETEDALFFPTATLPPGIYLLHVQTMKGDLPFKLVIEN